MTDRPSSPVSRAGAPSGSRLHAPSAHLGSGAERPDHVWSYDFVYHRTDDGRASRTRHVLDTCTRERLAIRIRRRRASTEIIDVLTDLCIVRGIPASSRSDTGPAFVAEAVRQGVAAVGAQTAVIEPGSL